MDIYNQNKTSFTISKHVPITQSYGTDIIIPKLEEHKKDLEFYKISKLLPKYKDEK